MNNEMDNDSILRPQDKLEDREKDIHRSDFTCEGCHDSETCVYAFDLYCTNGDCLAEK